MNQPKLDQLFPSVGHSMTRRVQQVGHLIVGEVDKWLTVAVDETRVAILRVADRAIKS